jgi:hypothetical protein
MWRKQGQAGIGVGVHSVKIEPNSKEQQESSPGPDILLFCLMSPWGEGYQVRDLTLRRMPWSQDSSRGYSALLCGLKPLSPIVLCPKPLSPIVLCPSVQIPSFPCTFSCPPSDPLGLWHLNWG